MSETTSPSLRLEIEAPLAWIIADNPARMNAFTANMWSAVPALIKAAEEDASVRVIILRGASEKAFSAGADISEFDSARTGDGAAAYDSLNDAAFNAVLGARKPTIAMIHGFCLGGGLALASCCDMRFADDKATFAIPAVKLGLGYNPRWIKPLLAILPPTRVKEIVLSGRRFTAQEVAQMQLVNRVLTPDALEQTTRDFAAEIAANAPLSVAAAKRAIDDLAANGAAADLAPLDADVAACLASADYAEGRRAFLEKRKPNFVGR